MNSSAVTSIGTQQPVSAGGTAAQSPTQNDFEHSVLAKMFTALAEARMDPERLAVVLVEGLRVNPSLWKDLDRYALLLRSFVNELPAEYGSPPAQSSSAPLQTLAPAKWADAQEALRDLIERGREQTFEDGIETPFSRTLQTLLSKHGICALQLLEQYCLSEAGNGCIIAEVLRQFGLSEQPETQEARFKILVLCLGHPSLAVRDAAAIGLAYLNDVRAVPHLRQAASRECSPDLRHDLREVIAQLEA